MSLGTSAGNALTQDLTNLTTGYHTRSEMLSSVDTLIQHWADTSTLKTSQERAWDMGLALTFRVPGATDAELYRINAERYSDVLPQFFDEFNLDLRYPVDPAHYAQTKAQVEAFGKMMGVLEKFNGRTFFNFGKGESSGFVDTRKLQRHTDECANDPAWRKRA